MSLSWAAVCSFCRILRDIAVVVAQFGLPISEQVAKIYRCFVVHSCDLHPFYRPFSGGVASRLATAILLPW